MIGNSVRVNQLSCEINHGITLMIHVKLVCTSTVKVML